MCVCVCGWSMAFAGFHDTETAGERSRCRITQDGVTRQSIHSLGEIRVHPFLPVSPGLGSLSLEAAGWTHR